MKQNRQHDTLPAADAGKRNRFRIDLSHTTPGTFIACELRQLCLCKCKALFAALDERTRIHCWHVEAFAVQVGQLLGLSASEMSRLALAALFHDIGKAAIRQEILLRKKQLSGREMEQIRLHPLLGARFWFALGGEADIGRAILSHHERYDGCGYPAGLERQRIPLLGRIITVADAFDAMLSSRHYRPPRNMPQAIAVFKKERGKQFDPEIIDLLLAEREYFALIRKETARKLRPAPGNVPAGAA